MHSLIPLLRTCLIALALLALGLPVLAGATTTTALVSASVSSPAENLLDADDWAYLRQKRTLVLGVPASAPPPLDLAYGGELKGITADVIAWLKQQLNVDVTVVYLTDRVDGVEALAARRIDLLASANLFERDGYGLALSRPYAADNPALYRRQADNRVMPDELAGLTVAVVQDYLPIGDLQKRYPGAHFAAYKDYAQAMGAMAFGRADLYLGDSLSARYLINQSYFSYVKLDRFVTLDSGGFAFAMRADDVRLRRIIDTMLGALGEDQLDSIAKHWAGGGFGPSEKMLPLTADEEQWLARHPVVSLIVNDDLAPVAYFDGDGNFSGIAADFLDIVTLRTGLRFKVERTGSFNKLQTSVQDGKADLTILGPSAQRKESLRFTAPFVTSSFVLVTPKDQAVRVNGLGDLAGKRVAVVEGHRTIPLIKAANPQVKIATPSTVLDSLAMVANGEADAAVVTMNMARHYISQLYDDRLAIAAQTDLGPALSSFAMRRGETELQSILDKAILDTPPDELNAIISHWRPNAAMKGQTWRDYRQVIAGMAFAALAVLAAFVAWIAYLRLQMRKRATVEKELRDYVRFVEVLEESIVEPTYVRDREGRLVSHSRSYAQALGPAGVDCLGKTALELPPDCFESDPDYHAAYLLAIELDETIKRSCLARIGGEERWIDHWIQPFRGPFGDIAGVICGWHDITDRQRLIEELERARQLADQASRAKTTFLATMSHEIRTPMSAIIGTLELARMHADQGVVDRAGIDVAYSSAKSLLGLIGDILDIVRIESGRLSLSPTRANLRELVESVARIFERLARQKGLDLVLDIDSAVNRDVLIDPLRFKQVLSNLVSNAIKFTDHGSVRIRIAGDVVEKDQLQVKLGVKDSGIGISPEDQQQLFRPFAQVAQASRNTPGGTGLGLAISRSLCEMMGGTLEMTSAKGKGTEIDVTLSLSLLEPELAPVARREHAQALEPARQLRILVVDDYDVNRRLLCQQLSLLGHEYAEAENGLLALELWRRSAFDLVITDCRMPVMKGDELARAIREEERRTKRVPCVILGLTADAQPEELRNCIAAGMDDCLIKPIELDALNERLLSIGAPSPRTPVVAEAPANHADREPIQASADYARGLQALINITGGDQAKMCQLVDQLMQSSTRDREMLHALVRKHDLPALAELAHRITGAARMFKDDELIQRCRQLEEACRKPELPLPLLRERVAAVEQALARLQQTFKDFRPCFGSCG